MHFTKILADKRKRNALLPHDIAPSERPIHYGRNTGWLWLQHNSRTYRFPSALIRNIDARNEPIELNLEEYLDPGDIPME